ncbi:MAG: hypothetical protein LC748_15260, partial [Thermomicrobia bacterium]|nr:hypothetical protein [Thermomicrobia bacterium]
MALADLLPLLRDQPWFTALMAAIEQEGARSIPLPGLTVAARPYVEAAIAVSLGRPVLIVTSRPDRAQDLIEAIGAYLPPDAVALSQWQTPDALPYEVLPRDPATAAPRLNILHRLATADEEGICPVVVTAAGGLMRPVMPVAELRQHTTQLRVGTRFNERERLREWIAWGYTTEPLVEQPGQLSRRGGIIDIFPPTLDSP